MAHACTGTMSCMAYVLSNLGHGHTMHGWDMVSCFNASLKPLEANHLVMDYHHLKIQRIHCEAMQGVFSMLGPMYKEILNGLQSFRVETRS